MALSMKEFMTRAWRGEHMVTGAYAGHEDAANPKSAAPAPAPIFKPAPAPAYLPQPVRSKIESSWRPDGRSASLGTTTVKHAPLRTVLTGPIGLSKSEAANWVIDHQPTASLFVSSDYDFTRNQTRTAFTDGTEIVVEGDIREKLYDLAPIAWHWKSGHVVTTSSIASNAITTDKIAAGAIEASRVSHGMGGDETVRCKDTAEALRRTIVWLKDHHASALAATDAGRNCTESQFPEVIFEVAATWDYCRYPAPKDEQRWQYVSRLKKELLAYNHDSYVALRKHAEPGWIDPATCRPGPVSRAITTSGALPSTASVGDTHVRVDGSVVMWTGSHWVEALSAARAEPDPFWPSGDTPYPVSYNEAPRTRKPKAKPVPVATEQDIDALTSEIADDLSMGGDW